MVGIGTALLALATFALAWAAWKSLEEQRAERQAAQRPLLVLSPKQPLRLESDRLELTVENVGMGPAINVRAVAENGAAGTIWAEGRTLQPLGGVGAGREGALRVQTDHGSLQSHGELRVRLAYEDAAGATYWTDARLLDQAPCGLEVAGPGTEPPSSFVSGRLLREKLP